MHIVVAGSGERRPRSLRELLLRFAANAAGLWLAAVLVPGVEVGDAPSLAAASAIFGLLNALVRPIAFLASACLIVLTFGLFVIVINAAMFALTAWISGQLELSLRVDGFWSALFGSLVVSLASFLAYAAARARRGGGGG